MAAMASSREDEIDAICVIHNIANTASLAYKLKVYFASVNTRDSGITLLPPHHRNY